MTAAIAGLITVLIIACGMGLFYAYEVGREAGQRQQRQVINRSLDTIRQQSLVAQRHIDYLYEQTQGRIDAGSDEGGELHERQP